MPYVTLMDLISNCPNQLEAGSIIVFDWCHRVLQPIEHIDIDCEDVQNCIDCEYILSQLQFGPGFIVGGWEMPCLIGLDPSYINTVVTAEFDCETGMLTIGNNTPIDLSCIADFRGFTFMDGLNNYTVANGDMIFVQWLHGMQCVVGNQLIQVDLPSGATNSQVLTWSTVNNAAYRANPLEICCDQIMDCVQPHIDGLQAQINTLSTLLCPCGWETPVYALSVADDGAVVDIHTQILDFVGDCWVLNVPLAWHVEVSLDPACLSVSASMIVQNTVFVMKNGNDWTGMAERFDRPFLTINAAISAWETLYSATNIPVDIIVYAGDYREEILLANNVNVYFHKSTVVRGIQTKRENVISKVTGHVSIHAWYRDPSTNRWYAIFSRHDWCEVAIDADLIFQDSEDWEESRLIHLRCKNSKRKINVWSIRTKEDMHRMIRQIWIEWRWTTLDYSCHLWNTMPLRHNFYNVSGQWCELHWTHSNVIQRGILIWTPNPTTVPNYPSFINSADERSRVYVDNVFIKWHYVEGGNDCTRWRFKSINGSVVAFNDFMLDMFPNTGNSRKRPVFWCENASYMLRYGKSMIRCNSTYDNAFTFNDTNATMYMFGNIICNRNPGTLSWFAYYQSAGVNNYDTTNAVYPMMPLDIAYDNS